MNILFLINHEFEILFNVIFKIIIGNKIIKTPYFLN